MFCVHLSAALLQVEAPGRAVTAQGTKAIENLFAMQGQATALRKRRKSRCLTVVVLLAVTHLFSQRLEQIAVTALASRQRPFGLGVVLTVGFQRRAPFVVRPLKQPRQ